MAEKATPAHLKGMHQVMQNILSNLAKQGSEIEDKTDVTWDDKSSKIVLPGDPERMTYDRVLEVIASRKAAAEQEYAIMERIPGMPLDAAAAFARVLKNRYGWVHATTKMTFFGPKPPKMQIVKTGHKPEDYIEVPVGQFKLDDISVNIETGFAAPGPDAKSQFMDFYVSGTVSHADRKVVMNLVTETRQEMERQSIYRGKPLRLRVDEKGNLAALVQPEFIDLEKVDLRTLILKDEIQGLIDLALNTPIEKTASCRKHNIPLKRGILLHGPYGTGKSLCGLMTAKRAVNSGWTYIMVDDASALAQALEFARQFQPAVVFAEDIDRVVDLNRTDNANDIVNTIDSILNKSDEVITVLTTNHIERLPAVILRHGRLDALVHIAKPDAKAALRLVHLYAGDLLPGNEVLTGLGERLDGLLPATVREVVERAKLGMLMRDAKTISLQDLLASATGIVEHAKLLDYKEPSVTKEHQLGQTLKELMLSTANGSGALDVMNERVEIIEKLTKEIRSNF